MMKLYVYILEKFFLEVCYFNGNVLFQEMVYKCININILKVNFFQFIIKVLIEVQKLLEQLGYCLCDVFVMVVVIDSFIVLDKVDIYVFVELNGMLICGMFVFDWRNKL